MHDRMQRVRRQLMRTPVIVAGLIAWFGSALGFAQGDVGPDWFDSHRYQHADAVVLGTGVALVVVLLVAVVRASAPSWRQRRRQRGRA